MKGIVIGGNNAAYGGQGFTADPIALLATRSCTPVDAHRPRTVQFGLKYTF